MQNQIVDLPKFKSHKIVGAAKITEIRGLTLVFGDIGQTVQCFPDFIQRHSPFVGSYYVVYDDAYASISPAKAFEDGYSPVSEAVSVAFNTLKTAIQSDDDYAYGWHANIAGNLHGDGVTTEQCEHAATRFMLAVFGVDMTKSPYFGTLGVITGDVEKQLGIEDPAPVETVAGKPH